MGNTFNIAFVTFLFEQQKVFEKIRLYLLVCFDRFLPFSAFASCWFLFELFWGIELFERSSTVASVLMEVYLVLELNLKTYLS